MSVFREFKKFTFKITGRSAKWAGLTQIFDLSSIDDMTWSYGLQFSLLETASADMNGKFQNKNIEFKHIKNLNLRGF